MALNLDRSHGRRKYGELVELVRAVLDCDDPGAEDLAVEWKSTLDLTKPAGGFHVARGILGFANRTVHEAARHFDGLAYFVVGVEPGSLPGMPRMDGADLVPQLEKYLGSDGPEWSHQNITIDGVNVIVFTVEAPSAGQRIWTLRKAYSDSERGNASEEGTIFVRRGGGRSKPAHSSDIRKLEQRLLDGASIGSPTVSIDVNSPDPINLLQVGDRPEELRVWLESVRAEYLKPLTAGAGSPFLPATARILGEKRSEGDYRQQVEDYLAKLKKTAWDRLLNLTSAALLRQMPIRLSITNDDDTALEDVLIEITTSSQVRQFFAPHPYDPPDAPAKWGLEHDVWRAYVSQSATQVSRSVQASFSPQVERREDAWVSRQEIKLIHGRTRIDLQPFVLIAEEPAAAADISVRVVAGNRRGSFDMMIPVTFTGPATWENTVKQ